MIKIKIGFDVDNGVWDAESFRLVMQNLIFEQDNYDVFLITKNTDSTYIDVIALQLGMNPGNVFQGLADNNAILTQLNTSVIQIYLTPYMEMSSLTNENSSNTIGVLVDNKQDEYNIQPKWFTQMFFWINRLKAINESKKNVC
jgi:hypothetical protein